MNSKHLIKIAFLNALGTFAYTAMISYVLFNGIDQKIFSEEFYSHIENTFLAPLTMLTLLMISATVTGSLVLGRPIYLIATKKIREGITLLIFTLICLAALVALALLGVTASYSV